eukprot:g30362.t1
MENQRIPGNFPVGIRILVRYVAKPGKCLGISWGNLTDPSSNHAHHFEKQLKSMPKKKKKFIEKKKAVKFSVVRRPVVGLDEIDAAPPPDFVLQPTYVPPTQDLSKLPNIPVDLLFDGKQLSQSVREEEARTKRAFLEDLAKAEDSLVHDYDYTQHLKPIGAGHFVEVEGVDPTLAGINNNRAKDSQAVDQDLQEALAALEADDGEMGALARGELDLPLAVERTDDFLESLEGNTELEFEQLQDDFVAAAMESGGEEHDEDEEDDEEDIPDDEMLQYTDTDAKRIRREKNRASESYSEGVEGSEELESDGGEKTELDANFEALLEEYEDEEIGGGDGDDPEGMGAVDNIGEEYGSILDEHIGASKVRYGGRLDGLGPDEAKSGDTEVEAATKQMLELLKNTEEEDIQSVHIAIDQMKARAAKDEWDAESIISTFSNLENHPTIIKAPRKDKRVKIPLTASGIPLAGLPDRKNGHQSLSEREGEADDDEPVNKGKSRSKEETKQEKAARKKAMKEERRQKRNSKKALKKAFKAEYSHQTASSLHQQTYNYPHVKL